MTTVVVVRKAGQVAVATYVQSALRHMKPVAAWGDGAEVLAAAGVAATEPGVYTSDKANRSFAKDLVTALSMHRHWDRADTHPTLAMLATMAGQED